ncbi:MAG TPA: hypothetical protein VH105_03205 [Burkholderiales bacterium]|nr:hypothetical protein [Burkholderiales bacterium]
MELPFVVGVVFIRCRTDRQDRDDATEFRRPARPPMCNYAQRDANKNESADAVGPRHCLSLRSSGAAAAGFAFHEYRERVALVPLFLRYGEKNPGIGRHKKAGMN